MKLITATILLAITVTAVPAVRAETIEARGEHTGDNTLISCSSSTGEEIERAFVTIYESDGSVLPVTNREMEISGGNIASYEVPGRHYLITGKCKLLLFEEDGARITRGEFALSMR